ncbi:hypothetical protein THRCLA_22019 [Thraustotheca clavata]|uniref:Uncharacterized protein n=1 Tax=Thraustotheca clavata TaxID=74557 RepID=A0A1V9ZDX8_9STRA|nr:hypothetical protein THRCLA_22019 [Thraustotheca clavata]
MLFPSCSFNYASNIKRKKEDELFFECVYYFVSANVKVIHPPEYWQDIEEELGYTFRGDSFNINGKAHLQLDLSSTATTPPKTPRFGAIVETPEHLRFITASTTERYGAFIQMVGINSIVQRVDATKQRVESNLKVAQAIRDKISHQRNTDTSSRTAQGKCCSFISLSHCTQN